MCCKPMMLLRLQEELCGCHTYARSVATPFSSTSFRVSFQLNLITTIWCVCVCALHNTNINTHAHIHVQAHRIHVQASHYKSFAKLPVLRMANFGRFEVVANVLPGSNPKLEFPKPFKREPHTLKAAVREVERRVSHFGSRLEVYTVFRHYGFKDLVATFLRVHFFVISTCWKYQTSIRSLRPTPRIYTAESEARGGLGLMLHLEVPNCEANPGSARGFVGVGALVKVPDTSLLIVPKLLKPWLVGPSS